MNTKNRKKQSAKARRNVTVLAAILHPGAGRHRKGPRRPKDSRNNSHDD